ncbi:MAG: hypothetical protein ACTSU7_00295 [Candidatus Heimdallarchaeaceae archaeon]
MADINLEIIETAPDINVMVAETAPDVNIAVTEAGVSQAYVDAALAFLVPYTGATGDVNLGTHDLTSTDLAATNKVTIDEFTISDWGTESYYFYSPAGRSFNFYTSEVRMKDLVVSGNAKLDDIYLGEPLQNGYLGQLYIGNGEGDFSPKYLQFVDVPQTSTYVIRPSVTNHFDLGSDNLSWKNLYLAGTANVSDIVMPSDSLIKVGSPTANTRGLAMDADAFFIFSDTLIGTSPNATNIINNFNNYTALLARRNGTGTGNFFLAQNQAGDDLLKIDGNGNLIVNHPDATLDVFDTLQGAKIRTGRSANENVTMKCNDTIATFAAYNDTDEDNSHYVDYDMINPSPAEDFYRFKFAGVSSMILGSTSGLDLGSNNLTTTGDITADQILLTNNGNGTNIKVGDDAYIGDIDTANFIGIKGIQDGNSGGIVFGIGEDTNLYRSAANTLTTDDDFVANSLASTDLNITNTGGQIANFQTSNGSTDITMRYGFEGYGWIWEYLGSGVGNDNKHVLWSEGAGGTDVQVYEITQDGKIVFAEQTTFTKNVLIGTMKSGATQVAAGAAANELWKTASHATLPDNVVLIGA